MESSSLGENPKRSEKKFENSIDPLVQTTIQANPELIAAINALTSFSNRWLTRRPRAEKFRAPTILQAQQMARAEFTQKYHDFDTNFARYRRDFERRVWNLSMQDSVANRAAANPPFDFDRFNQEFHDLMISIYKNELTAWQKISDIRVAVLRKGGTFGQHQIYYEVYSSPITVDDVANLQIADQLHKGYTTVQEHKIWQLFEEFYFPHRPKLPPGRFYALKFIPPGHKNEENTYGYMDKYSFEQMPAFAKDSQSPSFDVKLDWYRFVPSVWNFIGENLRCLRNGGEARSEAVIRSHLEKTSSQGLRKEMKSLARRSLYYDPLQRLRILYNFFPDKLANDRQVATVESTNWSIPLQKVALAYYEIYPDERYEARRYFEGDRRGAWVDQEKPPGVKNISREDFERFGEEIEFRVLDQAPLPDNFLLVPKNNQDYFDDPWYPSVTIKSKFRMVSEPVYPSFSSQQEYRLHLPKPLDWLITDLKITSDGVDVSRAFRIYEDSLTGDVDVQLVGDRPANAIVFDISFAPAGKLEFGHVRHQRVLQRLENLKNLPIERFTRVLHLLKEAGFRKLAKTLEESALLKELSLEQIAQMISETAVYSFDDSRSQGETSSQNPFSKLSPFINENGVACFQCNGAATLLEAVLNELFPHLGGFHFEIVTGYSYREGSKVITAQNNHAKVGVFYETQLVMLLDGTPHEQELQTHKEVHIEIVAGTEGAEVIAPLESNLISVRQKITESDTAKGFFRLKPDGSHPLEHALLISRLIIEFCEGKIDREAVAKALKSNRTIPFDRHLFDSNPADALLELLGDEVNTIDNLFQRGRDVSILKDEPLTSAVYSVSARRLINEIHSVVQDRRFKDAISKIPVAGEIVPGAEVRIPARPVGTIVSEREKTLVPTPTAEANLVQAATHAAASCQRLLALESAIDHPSGPK